MEVGNLSIFIIIKNRIPSPPLHWAVKTLIDFETNEQRFHVVQLR